VLVVVVLSAFFRSTDSISHQWEILLSSMEASTHARRVWDVLVVSVRFHQMADHGKRLDRTRLPAVLPSARELNHPEVRRV
jgi:hypothetical protein